MSQLKLSLSYLHSQRCDVFLFPNVIYSKFKQYCYHRYAYDDVHRNMFVKLRSVVLFLKLNTEKSSFKKIYSIERMHVTSSNSIIQEPPKFLSSSGKRGTKFISVYNFLAQ